LRIGHYVSHFPEPGGTTNAMLGISAGFVRNGHHVVVYGNGSPKHPSEAEETIRRASAAGVVVPDIHDLGRVPARKLRRRVLSALARNRDHLDVLVIHSVFGPFHPAIERASRRGHIPCVACPNDPYGPELFRQRKMLKTVYWHMREAPFLRKMQAIQVLAPSHAGHLRDRGIDVPTFAIPNGLEPNQLAPADAAFEDPGLAPGALEHADPDRLRLLFFGRWDVYNKGLDLLLDAIAADASMRSSVRLQIAGRGSESDGRTLARLIERRGLARQVSVVGFLPDVRSAIRAADFLVLPSRFDGFAQAVIETLAIGTPVIVSRRAGSSEYFGPEEGALVTDPDVSSLARTLRAALGSKAELRSAARAAHGRLARDFNWDAVARRWVEEAERLGVLRTAD
jgi:glycosyltransferase involved in cell wall biosynthesis